MKKIVITLCLLAVVFQSAAFAEPYKSNKVPPENILSKTVAKLAAAGAKIIGKFKHSEDHYTVYYVYPSGQMFTKSLVRLDTNIWIYADADIVHK